MDSMVSFSGRSSPSANAHGARSPAEESICHEECRVSLAFQRHGKSCTGHGPRSQNHLVNRRRRREQARSCWSTEGHLACHSIGTPLKHFRDSGLPWPLLPVCRTFRGFTDQSMLVVAARLVILRLIVMDDDPKTTRWGWVPAECAGDHEQLTDS